MKSRSELNRLLYERKTRQNKPVENDYFFLRTGDIEGISSQLESGKISLPDRRLSDNKLKNAVYNFILEAGRLSGIAVSAGMSADESEALADIYIAKADKCTDTDGVKDNFVGLCLDMTERIGEITSNMSASPHVRKCRLYIYANLGADLSVKALARITGLDPSYLSKLFSEETGIPIKKFVTLARVDTAKNLLRYTDIGLSEMAYSLGFSSQSAFIRTFGKVTGTTPKRYRDSMK